MIGLPLILVRALFGLVTLLCKGSTPSESTCVVAKFDRVLFEIDGLCKSLLNCTTSNNKLSSVLNQTLCKYNLVGGRRDDYLLPWYWTLTVPKAKPRELVCQLPILREDEIDCLPEKKNHVIFVLLYLIVGHHSVPESATLKCAIIFSCVCSK